MWLTDLENEVIYHLPGVFPPLVIVYVRIRLPSSLDRRRRDLSSWVVVRLVLDRLRLIVYCSMCFEWSWLFRFVRCDPSGLKWLSCICVYVAVLLWGGALCWCCFLLSSGYCDIRLLSTYLSKGIGVLTIPKDLHHGGG